MSFGIDFWCRFRFYRLDFQGFMWRAGNTVNLRERAKQGETPPNHSGCLQCPLLSVSVVEQFQLSLGGSFVRASRASLAPATLPLSDFGSAPAGLRNSQPSTKLPHTGDASAGALDRKSTRLN